MPTEIVIVVDDMRLNGVLGRFPHGPGAGGRPAHRAAAPSSGARRFIFPCPR